ncbi:MAG: TRAP transporter small permease subunit [Alphaproteobacteria bacterium]|nr:TRAP transporter small permease subunit [Alphaproteobacteria bacterium]
MTMPPGSPATGLWAAMRATERTVAALGTITIIVCVLWGVVTRYISHMPSSWTSEVAAIAFCWSCLFGGALLYDTDGHPRMFSPFDIRNRTLRRWFLAAGGLIEAVVLAMVAAYSIKQIYVNFDNPTSILRISVGVFYLPLAWFGLASLARLAHGIRKWT